MLNRAGFGKFKERNNAPDRQEYNYHVNKPFGSLLEVDHMQWVKKPIFQVKESGIHSQNSSPFKRGSCLRMKRVQESGCFRRSATR